VRRYQQRVKDRIDIFLDLWFECKNTLLVDADRLVTMWQLWDDLLRRHGFGDGKMVASCIAV
jgi:hypothetical protein